MRGRRLAWVAVLTVATCLGAAGITAAPPAPASSPSLRTPAAWASSGSVRGLPPRSDADVVDWVGRGTLPGRGTPWGGMVRDAVLDLRRLTASSGAVAAGAADYWAYTWPRDTSFGVVALLRTGHRGDALRALGFLQRVQAADGGFQARYLLDGSGVPDGRPAQADAPGWVLWALGRLAADSPADLTGLRGLLDRSAGYAARITAAGTRLPDASPDYWEVPESRLTLGAVAPLLAGLRGAAAAYRALRQESAVTRMTRAADRLERLVVLRFGPGGYQRYAGWGGHDAAVAFLLPPFTGIPLPGAVEALEDYRREARRAAGGVAPGASWKQDGVSWTPETALLGYAQANMGDRAAAGAVLDWLDAHRTTWGSLPEKVNVDGAPAGPAPLAWTAALVILTVAALDAA